jgi:hypothetical protein
MDKAEMQRAIIETFGEKQVEKLRKETCTRCVNWETTHCKYSLLPITTTGERCPYFQSS